MNIFAMKSASVTVMKGIKMSGQQTLGHWMWLNLLPSLQHSSHIK